jgi:hypothetical protein
MTGARSAALGMLALAAATCGHAHTPARSEPAPTAAASTAAPPPPSELEARAYDVFTQVATLQASPQKSQVTMRFVGDEELRVGTRRPPWRRRAHGIDGAQQPRFRRSWT